MKNFLKLIQHLLALFYYAHLTEKLPGVNYEGKDKFNNRLSKSILAHVAGRFAVAGILFWMTNGFENADTYNWFNWFVTWFFIDIVGALVGAIIIPAKVRTRYAYGCWMPLVGIFIVALFEKYAPELAE